VLVSKSFNEDGEFTGAEFTLYFMCSSDEGLVDEADEGVAAVAPSGGNITLTAYREPFLDDDDIAALQNSDFVPDGAYVDYSLVFCKRPGTEKGYAICDGTAVWEWSVQGQTCRGVDMLWGEYNQECGAGMKDMEDVQALIEQYEEEEEAAWEAEEAQSSAGGGGASGDGGAGSVEAQGEKEALIGPAATSRAGRGGAAREGLSSARRRRGRGGLAGRWGASSRGSRASAAAGSFPRRATRSGSTSPPRAQAEPRWCALSARHPPLAASLHLPLSLAPDRAKQRLSSHARADHGRRAAGDAGDWRCCHARAETLAQRGRPYSWLLPRPPGTTRPAPALHMQAFSSATPCMSAQLGKVPS